LNAHLHLDCAAGVSGDMLLGALCELHGSTDLLLSVPARLKLPHVRVECSRTSRQHLAAQRVTVTCPEGEPVRHLSHVEAILALADLPELVREMARRVFQRLAEAEARVHGSTIEQVHFHEVGAADALVDIAGTCLLVHELAPGRVTAGSVPLSGGTVVAAHGVLPLPAPAVLELLKGWPVEWLEEEGERVTPTGAALLTTLAVSGRPSCGTLLKSGYGAGSTDFTSRANVVRALLLQSASSPASLQPVTELACVIDNSTGEDLAFALEILLGEGALDVYYAPTVMKKGRPGWELGVICDADAADRLANLVLRFTGSSGVRRRDIGRYALGRDMHRLATRFGEIRVKVLETGDGTLRAAPEFEDCRQAALRHGLPVAEVRQEVLNVWHTSGRKG
jgi:hypothetical protein